MVVFLSWHNSLPGFIQKVYHNLSLPKSFISTDFIKGLDDNRLMSSSNSYKAPTDYSMINLLENLKPSHIVVWNGDFNDSKRGFQVKLISLIKSTFPISCKYLSNDAVSLLVTCFVILSCLI